MKTSLNNEGSEKVLRISTKDANACLPFYMGFLDHRIGYLFSIDNKNIKDRSFHFWVLNENEKTAPIDTYLKDNNELTSSYFVLSPQENFGNGYSLHFDNFSIGKSETINEIGKIGAYPIPYNFISSLRFENNPFKSKEINQKMIMNVSHPNESLYIAEYDPTNAQDQTIVLSQGFDKGWAAYQVRNKPNFLQVAFPFLFGQKVKNHVQVNNWENGWKMENLNPKTFHSK